MLLMTLTDGTTDADIMIRVASSQGFPSPEEGRPTFVRVRKEWIKYRQKARRHFVVDENGRGARGTVAASHPKGARVRVGHTFSIVTYVPTYKEDWSDDQEAARRAGVRYVPR